MPQIVELRLRTLADNNKLTRHEHYLAIDEHYCGHIGITPHPDHWYRNWPDIIGESLAMNARFGDPPQSYEDILRSLADCNYSDDFNDLLAWFMVNVVMVSNYREFK